MANRGRPREYSDKQRFIMIVLWISGFSAATIADFMTRHHLAAVSGSMVKSQVRQTPLFVRSKYTVEQRQNILNYLKANRLDDGQLSNTLYKVRR